MWFVLVGILVLGALAVCYRIGRRSGTKPAEGKVVLPQVHKSSPPSKASLEDLHFDAIAARSSDRQSGSYLGGSPPRSSDYSWPLRDGRPLAFLACIDMAEVPPSSDLDWLPRKGLLLFFYDMEKQPWGYDPADRGGSATIFLPDVAKVETGSSSNPPVLLPKDAVFPKRYLSFHRISLPPNWNDPRLEGWDDEVIDGLEAKRSEEFGRHPHHQIGGLPEAIQDPNMGLESQSVINDSVAIQNEYVAALEKEGLMRLLEANRLDADKDFSESRKILAALRKIAEGCRDKTGKVVNSIPERVEKYKLSPSAKRAYLAGYERSKSTSANNAEQTWKLELEVLDHMGRAIDHLEEIRDKWTVEDSTIVFAEDKDLDTYNAIIAEIDAIAAKQTQMQEDAKEQFKGQMEKVKDSLSQ